MRALLIFSAFAFLALPCLVLALETQTATVGKLNVVWETEGPFVESGQQVFALASNETLVSVEYEDAERFVDFLRANCEQTPGCELTYETTTRAVIAAKSPSGQSTFIPYTLKSKKNYPGEPREVNATLHSWLYDTFSLSVRTSKGWYCIPNNYVWNDYHKRVYDTLALLGKPENEINVEVILTVYPCDNPDDECMAFIADVRTVK